MNDSWIFSPQLFVCQAVNNGPLSRMLCRSTQDTAVLPFVSTVLTPIPLYYHCHRLPSPASDPHHKLLENKEKKNVNMLTNTVRKDSGLLFWKGVEEVHHFYMKIAHRTEKNIRFKLAVWNVTAFSSNLQVDHVMLIFFFFKFIYLIWFFFFFKYCVG